ncbi:ESPR-type extended signal peptide-containing protein [Dialister sp.]|jgi:autotransporter adhesin|uniref:ESPR-type extended signal peptide-containing protein n=1 Tax=Dialister sp. TaxID=1955814 RepID=UPI003A5C3949
MNKIYKVVWNKARNCYVVASEFAKNHQTGSSRIKAASVAAVMAATMLTIGTGVIYAADDVTDTRVKPIKETISYDNTTDKTTQLNDPNLKHVNPNYPGHGHTDKCGELTYNTTLTIGDINKVVDRLVENDNVLYAQDIKNVTMENGSISLIRNDGSPVTDKIALTGNDGTNGQDTSVTVKVGDKSQTFQTGSVVTAETDANGKATGLTINGTPYDIKDTTYSAGDNVTIDKDGHTDYKVNLNKDLTGIESMTNGSSSIRMGNGGTVTINNRVTIDQSGKISGVAAGRIAADSTDAINGSQLKDVESVANKGWNLSTNGNEKATQVKPGDTVDFSGDDNISVANDGTKVTMTLKKDLTGLNSAKFGDTTINTDGLTVGSGTSVLAFSTKRVSVGGQQIHDVADGEADMDAVNMRQLNKQTAASKTTVSDGTNTTVTSTAAEDGHTDYKVNLNKDLTGIESMTNGSSSIRMGNGGTVTINKVTIDQSGKISGVAAGRIAADSTDAINGSQLHAVQQEAGKHTKVVKGSNITVEETDQDGQKTYKVGLNKDLLLGDIPGKNVSISGTNGTIETTGSITTKDRVYADKGAKLADVDITKDTLSNGPSKVVLNEGYAGMSYGNTNVVLMNNSVYLNGKVNVDKAGQIHNVTAGTADEDAVNVSQLKGVESVANKGWNLSTNGNEKATQVKPGDTVDFSGDDNISVANDGTKVTMTLKKDLTGLNSAKFGDTTINTDGLTVGSGTSVLAFSTKRVSVGGQQIHDVADGEADMDAVNMRQLNKQTAASKTTVSDGTNTTVTSTAAEDGHTDYKVNLNKDLTGIESMTNGSSSIHMGNGGTVTINNRVTIDQSGKISGVAAGRIAADSTDAINGSQLHAVQQEAGKHTKVVKGSNITVEETDQDGQKTYKVGLNKDLLLGDIPGKNVSISGTNGTIETTGSITTKDRVYADKGAKLADVDITGDTISNDKSSVKLDKEGTVTVNNKVTIDGNGKVSGVAAGEISDTSTDAVNGSQLKATNDRVSKVEGDITNIKGDITTIKGDVTKLGDRVTKVEQTAGKHSSVSTTDSNLSIDSTGTNDAGGIDYKVSLKNDLKLDSVTTGNTVMNKDGVTVGKDISLTKDGLTAGDTKVTNAGLSISDKTYVSKDGLNANNQTITNVANGKVEKGSTEAVNGGQLYNETRVAKDGNFVKKSNTAGENLSALDNQVTANTESIYHMNGRISDLDNRVNKVGAGAAALAALHPLDFDPDAKWDFAAGYGNYRGANAAAVGAYYRPNEDTMFSVGGTFGNGENMVNAGVSFKLGSGSSHVSTSRVAMAKEIKELRGELEAMKSAMLDANAGKKIDTSKLQLFPDVPQNHWAYEYVAQLAGNGMIEGYPDGNFAGDRPMTRYEFAAILYRAMTKGAVLSDKILSEFSHELEYFTVDTIAKDKAGNPTIQRVRTVKENKNK